MRTVMVVGLVVGPVLLLGAPVALTPGVTSGVTLPPWAANGAFVLAGAAALGGILLVALSFRRPRPARPSALPALSEAAPAALPPARAATAPLGTPSRVGSRYVVSERGEVSVVTAPRVVFCHPAARVPEARSAGGTGGSEPLTTPAAPDATTSRYVTLRTRGRPARSGVSAGGVTAG